MLVHREYASIHASAFAALLIRDWLSAHEKAMRAQKTARQPVVLAPGRASLGNVPQRRAG